MKSSSSSTLFISFRKLIRTINSSFMAAGLFPYRVGSKGIRKILINSIENLWFFFFSLLRNFPFRYVSLIVNGVVLFNILLTDNVNFLSDCGSFRKNTLRSPGYPNNYPRNMDCVYRVPIPFDQKLVIDFNFFSLENTWNCV